LAKLISWGKNRPEAIAKLKRALDEFLIEGVPTVIPFFKVLLEKKDFLEGNFTTDFIEKSGILRELEPQIPKTEVTKTEEKLEEKEIAEIIYQIYQGLKKSAQPSSAREFPSHWVMSERLKMFE